MMETKDLRLLGAGWTNLSNKYDRVKEAGHKREHASMIPLIQLRINCIA